MIGSIIAFIACIIIGIDLFLFLVLWPVIGCMATIYIFGIIACFLILEGKNYLNDLAPVIIILMVFVWPVGAFLYSIWGLILLIKVINDFITKLNLKELFEKIEKKLFENTMWP
jgi:hypothetical protein